MEEIYTEQVSATKSVSQLKDKAFLIEKYQRGYRWGTQQIVDLLDDVFEYGLAKKELKNVAKFYCLQPLVVKNENGWMELIDGQQRATTIYIILSALGLPNFFQISYSTRGNTDNGGNTFLSQISKHSYLPKFKLNREDYSVTDDLIFDEWHEIANKQDTVDNFYFYRAYYVVKLWLNDLDKLTLDEFKETLLRDTRVIWYEKKIGDSEESIEKTFLKFNDGKISLDQAELIKALFVLDLSAEADFTKRNYELNKFADEWNEIEHRLQNDRFWYFVSNNKFSNEEANRINLLFDILKDKGKKDDKLYAYRMYDKEFKNIDNKPVWDDVGNLYSRLEEWFEERKIYHLVGTVINLQIIDLISIKKEFDKKENKQKFKKYLQQMIRTEFFEDDGQSFKKKYDLEKVRYGTNNLEITRLLMLHNIAITEIEDPYQLFPFNRLKNVKSWTLEHILAQNVQDFESMEEMKAYQEDLIEMWNERKKEGVDADKEKEFQRMSDQLSEFSDKNNLARSNEQLREISKFLEDSLGLHEIDNLCLLDGVSNTKIGNALFKRKRNILLDMDKEIKLNDEAYVPMATSFVFQKRFSNSRNITQMIYWSEKDRQDYRENINNTIAEFLK